MHMPDSCKLVNSNWDPRTISIRIIAKSFYYKYSTDVS